MTSENKAAETKNTATEVKNVPKGPDTKKLLLILGIVAMLCATAVVIVVLLREKADIAEGPVHGGNFVVDEDNLADIQAMIEEKVAKGMFETHMNTTWTFPDGKSASSDAVMGNSASNNYPFWFDVLLKDTRETVYTSSLIPVGMNLKEIVLSEDLDAGAYPAVVRIHMVEEDGTELESNMGFNITLIVEN